MWNFIEGFNYIIVVVIISNCDSFFFIIFLYNYFYVSLCFFVKMFVKVCYIMNKLLKWFKMVMENFRGKYIFF